MTLAFIPLDERSLSQLSFMPVGSHPPPLPHVKAASRSFICSDYAKIMFERSRGIASTASWTVGLTGAASLRRRAARHWPASPGAQRVRGYRAAPQWDRMGSGSGGAAYRRFIAQFRLISVGLTSSWMVCMTTSFKNTSCLRVWKLKRGASET